MALLKTALALYYSKANRYGLTAVAGALDSGPGAVPVHFVRRREELPERLRELLARHELVVLGVSFFTTQVAQTAALVRELAPLDPRRLLLLAGGPHPSGDPEGTLAMGFNAVVVGEGEETLRDLLDVLAAGGDLAKVRGIAFRGAGGAARITGRRPPLDLDRFPSWCASQRKFAPVEITRGCPFGCAFCQTTFLFGSAVRHRSLDSVREHVRVLRGRGIHDIRFTTPNAFAWGSPDGRALVPEALEELLHAVREEAGPAARVFFGSFPSEVRPEHVTPRTLRLVRELAVNDNLVIGAQTGSPRLLERLHRGHAVDDVLRAAGLIVAAGFRAYVDFIFGLPGETEEDLDETMRLVRRLAESGAVIHAHHFLPLPGTPLAQETPGRLAPRLRELIRELTARGLLFGEWHRQARKAGGMGTGPQPSLR